MASWVFVLAIVAAMGAYVALVFGYGNLAGPGPGREVELEWPGDLSPEASAARLFAAGIIDHPQLFALYLRATQSSIQLRKGAHLLTDDLSPRAILRRMDRTMRGAKVKFRLYEGFHRFEVAKRLSAAHIAGAHAFLAATTDRELLGELHLATDSAEGYLYPTTYELALDSDPRDVVRQFKNEFDKRWIRLAELHPDGLSQLKRTLGWEVPEIVTLASVIEKEAGVDDERPVIASVFLNRLRDPGFTPHRLQSDPTSGYGCVRMPERIPSCRAYAGRILPEMNADEANPYSTYRHDFLPPGPISNPSEKTLEAVLAPAESHYYYFVARGEGRHNFSETYGQHNEAIRRSR